MENSGGMSEKVFENKNAEDTLEGYLSDFFKESVERVLKESSKTSGSLNLWRNRIFLYLLNFHLFCCPLGDYVSEDHFTCCNVMNFRITFLFY